jgi:hypothetical protein
MVLSLQQRLSQHPGVNEYLVFPLNVFRLGEQGFQTLRRGHLRSGYGVAGLNFTGKGPVKPGRVFLVKIAALDIGQQFKRFPPRNFNESFVSFRYLPLQFNNFRTALPLGRGQIVFNLRFKKPLRPPPLVQSLDLAVVKYLYPLHRYTA